MTYTASTKTKVKGAARKRLGDTAFHVSDQFPKQIQDRRLNGSKRGESVGSSYRQGRPHDTNDDVKKQLKVPSLNIQELIINIDRAY